MKQKDMSQKVSNGFKEKHPTYFTLITHGITVLVTVFATLGGQILVEKMKPQPDIKYKVTNSPSVKKDSLYETLVYIEFENRGSNGTAIYAFAPKKGDQIVNLDYNNDLHMVTEIALKNSDTKKLQINLNEEEKFMVVAKLIGTYGYNKNSEDVLKIHCQEK